MTRCGGHLVRNGTRSSARGPTVVASRERDRGGYGLMSVPAPRSTDHHRDYVSMPGSVAFESGPVFDKVAVLATSMPSGLRLQQRNAFHGGLGRKRSEVGVHPEDCFP